jgi:tetratricopeptide (TPR) repeat protein
MKDQRQKFALQEIRDDLENARTAWGYWIREGDASQLMKFLHSFWVFYDIQGWQPAGIDLFEQGVQVMQVVSTEEAQACCGWLLAVQGLFSVPVADYDPGPENVQKPLWLATYGLYNTIGAGPERGFMLAQKGNQILQRLEHYNGMRIIPLISLFITASQVPGQDHTSRQAALDCLKIATEVDDRWAIAKAKQFLAVKAIEAGEYAEAEQMAHEALVAFEANGDHWSISVVCIEVLGLLAIALRQFDEAKAWIRRGLGAAEEIDFKYSIQTAYWQLGYVAALEEKYVEAGNHWNHALAVSDRMLGGRSFLGFGNRTLSVDRGGH